MKGYIYKLYKGADPHKGWTFNDPIFGKKASLGACMPNIRGAVELGDWIFCISGKIVEKSPYIVGGFQVDEKISAIEANLKYPEFRLQKNEFGQIIGNIIVDDNGDHHPLDDHDKFEKRRENYVLGKNKIYIESPQSVERSRQKTLEVLQKTFGKSANRIDDLVPRWRKLDEGQIETLVGELKKI
ncbi:hypothetical protein ACD589_12470 [Rhizobium sp. 814_E9_N1_1]|uniref:Nmad2 family putative nucleotide modification protein n=1 Tax=unclassified Rhizobium TaxID=2613769 RepID=UPI003F242CF4